MRIRKTEETTFNITRHFMLCSLGRGVCGCGLKHKLDLHRADLGQQLPLCSLWKWLLMYGGAAEVRGMLKDLLSIRVRGSVSVLGQLTWQTLSWQITNQKILPGCCRCKDTEQTLLAGKRSEGSCGLYRLCLIRTKISLQGKKKGREMEPIFPFELCSYACFLPTPTSVSWINRRVFIPGQAYSSKQICIWAHKINTL